MKKRAFAARGLFTILQSLALGSAVHAQSLAIRTWVSGLGDDANPCSRTAPCKTFPGAISKTAAKGEVSVLDPGGFLGFTVTKSITISSEGLEAGVLVAGTNAIVIDATPADVVVLRGLDIEGLGTGLTGIKVLGGGAVHVENCTINNFTQIGIDFVPSRAAVGSTSELHVSDTIVRNNNGEAGGGIRIKPGANVTARGSLERVQLRNNTFGLRVEDNSETLVKDSVAADNGTAGFAAFSNATAATLNLFRCAASGNFVGVSADNPNATVRVADTMLAGNVKGFVDTAGGRTVSFGNTFNADSGAPNDAGIPPQ